ncbi:MAG TPA: hypothetical protein VM120_06630 [Bryobacteraceae bacterium]|nr:hypothetical protein [Bryobacteraceae bacterium]
MKRIAGFLLLAALTLSATGRSKVTRASIAALEKSFDRRLDSQVLEGDPFLLLGMTRGVYVEGFGIVYSAEVNLAPVPGISPFHREMTKADWTRVRQKKLQRLPLLRIAMKQMLLDSAASLDGIALEEQTVLGVSLTRDPGEDTTGIPSQIVMQGQKKDLLEIQTGKRDKAQLDTVIKVQEY